VKLRLFAQSFIGEVRKWFKAFTPGSIRNWVEFEDNFLRKWGNINNLVQALTEYNSLRRESEETVQKFSKRFNEVFNSIPAHLKPPEALAQMRYAEAFDYVIYLLLRERESATLAEMQSDVVKVEVNLIAVKKSKMGKTKLKEEEKPSSSTSEDKLDSMMKTMENFMERLDLGNTSAPPMHHEPQFRNPQFKRPQNQQRPRENRNQQPDPLVRPPFQQNLVDEEDDPKIPEESIHCLKEEMSRGRTLILF